MDNVCLTCRISGNLCNLTSKEYEDAARKFASLITLQIQANDSLPWYICRKCIETLNTVHEFVRWCKEAEQRMREELGRQSEKTHEELQMTTSSIKKEPADTMEDEQLLHENASGNYTIEQDLAAGEMDLDEDRKDIFLEEPKSAEPTPTGSSFEKGSDVYQHMKTHDNDRVQQRDRNFSCQSCQKLYVSYGSLNQHVRRAHMGKKPFVCHLCGKDFPQEADLEAHRHPCKQLLEQKQNMFKHFKCDFCGKNFLLKGSLKAHRRSHTKETPYGCDVCPKKFSFKGNLKRHQLIHSDERPYKCNLCNKAFRGQYVLKLHMFIHGGKSILKPVKTETPTVIAEDSMVKVKQETSEVIEHVKKEELSDECVEC